MNYLKKMQKKRQNYLKNYLKNQTLKTLQNGSEDKCNLVTLNGFKMYFEIYLKYFETTNMGTHYKNTLH